MNSRERFLAACHNQPTDRTPIWLMRQAGRYLPEYRTLRKKHTFHELIQSPELATEVTLQPLRRFPLDVAIVFHDILSLPEAIGQPFQFRDGGGISMAYPLSPSNVDTLNPLAIPQKLTYLFQTLTLLRRELPHKALVGFCGSPWTLACYMVESGSSKTWNRIRDFISEEPRSFMLLMEKLTQALITCLNLQIESGVDAIQIFDSLGEICSNENYWDISLQWIKHIISSISKKIPIILFTKKVLREELLKTGAQVFSFDESIALHTFKKDLPGNLALQGNLSPTLLCNSTPHRIQQEAKKILTDMAPYNGHIFNLGHGVLPNTKIENVEALVEAVQQTQ